MKPHDISSKRLSTNCLTMMHIEQNNIHGGCCFKLGFGLCAGGVSEVPAAVGMVPAPAAAVASVFQLPSHQKPPQTTIHER